MATYTGIKKIKIGDNVFELDMPSTAADVGIKFGYATSGNNRAVLQDSSGNLYVTQKDDNTDTKVSTAAVTSGTTYYPVVGADTTSAATKFYDKTGIVYKGTNGTTSAVGSAILTLGNSTASGTANNKQGQLVLYGSTAYAHTISGAPTAARTLTLPNATGTIALTSDIPDVSGKIDTAGTGLSKSGTTLNHSNAVAAQSTQAIYPIKIDGQGHISAYGTAVTPLTASSSLNAAKLTGTVPASCYTDTNTTYALSGALSSHVFTSTLTAGGSGSGTSTSVLTLAEGTGISLTDDTTNNTITVGHSNSITAGTAGTSSATSGSTLAVPYVTYDAQGHITAKGTHTHTITGFVPTDRTINGQYLTTNITLTPEHLGLSTSTISVNITTSTGTYVSSVCRRYGEIIQLNVGIRNTSAVASGGDFYVGTFNSALPAPIMITTTATYFGKTPVTASLSTGKVLTVRNSSPNSVTIGSSSTVYVTFTYLTTN